MKNIIFLEDYPERLALEINKIKSEFGQNIGEIRMLYYCKDIEEVEKSFIEQLKNRLDVEEIILVDFWDFEEKVDKLYSDKNNIFIFDTQLNEKKWDDFDYMPNVNYALGKKNEKNNGRIWFYTIAGPYYKDRIVERFPDYILEAKVVAEGKKIELDLDSNEKFKAMMNS